MLFVSRTAVVSLVACLAACSSSTTDPGTSTQTSGGAGGASSSGGHGGGGAPGSAGTVSSSAGSTSSFAGTFSSSGGVTSGGESGGGAANGGSSSGGTSGGTGGSSSGGMSSAGSGQGGAGGSSSGLKPKESWIWVWQEYTTMLAANGPVFAKPAAFTHVSPALYNFNNNGSYSSGAIDMNSSNFDGMTAKQVATAIHNAGLKVIPLMYAGSGNSGTDAGIKNVLNNATTQKNFIDALVADAVANGYDGYNLDWEVNDPDTTYTNYGTKLVSFLTAFTAALHAHNMISSFDTAGWYTRQCADDGLVDLSKIGNSVDEMIMEDYSGTFLSGGNKLGTKCAASIPSGNSCDNDFVGELNTMCDLAPGVGNIGLMSPYGNEASTNKFLDKALAAVEAYGFREVSLWPDNGTITDTGVPTSATDSSIKTWRTWLAWWLAQP